MSSTPINIFDTVSCPHVLPNYSISRSGKSNILDAICFLMGITNLSHVRAENLQVSKRLVLKSSCAENLKVHFAQALVYKNGQAGVTKASVSITFDNRDKKQ